MRELDYGQVYDIAPDQQAVTTRIQQPGRVTGGVSWHGDGRDAGHHLSASNRPHPIRIGRQHGLGDEKVLLLSGAEAAEGRLVPPEVEVIAMNNELGVWKTAWPDVSTRPAA